MGDQPKLRADCLIDTKRLAELRRMLDGAGPQWGTEDADNPSMVTAGKDEDGAFVYIADCWKPDEDAALIAALRNAAPELLDLAADGLLWRRLKARQAIRAASFGGFEHIDREIEAVEREREERGT